MESISAFEIIKVGVGPSSSHTMGPWSAAGRFTERLRRDEQLPRVQAMQVWLYGSLAKTGHGHGTDVAVLMGLSGLDFTRIDTETIPERVEAVKNEGLLLLGGEHTIAFDYHTQLVFDLG